MTTILAKKSAKVTRDEKLDALLNKANKLMGRLEKILPAPAVNTDWTALAYRWRTSNGQAGYLQPIRQPHKIRLADLLGIDRVKNRIDANTRQFLRGLPANNALLWGPRGTGKSSLVKALLNEHAAKGLRLIEIETSDLADLHDVIAQLSQRSEKYIIYCDDLSFEGDDASYKALKSVLDGGLNHSLDNVLVYATSNRRHLMPEYQSENQQAHMVDGELHLGEAIEEKVSLSDRFGLWLSLHPFKQDEYLAIVDHWLLSMGMESTQRNPNAREAALRWALTRGSRSGRVAWQFARDWVGNAGL